MLPDLLCRSPLAGRREERRAQWRRERLERRAGAAKGVITGKGEFCYSGVETTAAALSRTARGGAAASGRCADLCAILLANEVAFACGDDRAPFLSSTTAHSATHTHIINSLW